MKNNILKIIGFAVIILMQACSGLTDEVLPVRTENAAVVLGDALLSTNASAIKAENTADLQLIIEAAQPGDQAILYLDKEGKLQLKDVPLSDYPSLDAHACESKNRYVYGRCAAALLQAGKCLKARMLKDGTYIADVIPCMD